MFLKSSRIHIASTSLLLLASACSGESDPTPSWNPGLGPKPSLDAGSDDSGSDLGDGSAQEPDADASIGNGELDGGELADGGELDAGEPDGGEPDDDVVPTGGLCTKPIRSNAALLSNGFGFDLANTRNQLSAIRASNVATLQVEFAHAAQGATGKRGAPAVTQQAVFFSAGTEIVAMDRRSGCTYWTYTISDSSSDALLGENLVRSSTILFLEASGDKPALVFAGDARGNVYAINAVTGKTVWERFLGTSPEHHWITGGFQHHNGKLFVPYSSREVIKAALPLDTCCKTHGLLVAVDAYTGQEAWTYHTTPEATLQLSTLKFGPSGAAIWGVPTVDPKRNLLYVGTGQNYTTPATDTSDAIIALDIDTGEQKWLFQARTEDVWNAACEIPLGLGFNCVLPAGHDFDFGAPPVLVKRSDGRDTLLAADKGGIVYSLDPDNNGALDWARSLGLGSALGGVHWGIAVDESRVYAAITDAFVDKTSAIGDLGGNLPIEPVEGGSPGIYALDILTGEQVWSIRPTHLYQGEPYVSIYSAALTVTNDVLFAGALDGEIAAFSTHDGTELWRFDTDIEFTDVHGAAGEGGTIDSIGAIPVGDTLLLNSGYDNFGGVDAYQAGKGNALFVFRLPR